MKIRELCDDAILLTLLIVASKISFNIGVIPITMQTLVVILIGFLANIKNISLIYLAYFAMGLLGLPVFSGGGGFAYIFMPSFGFILGFYLAGLIMNLFKNDSKIILLIKGLIGLFIIYLAGVSYMYLIMNYYLGSAKTIMEIIKIGVLPFIIKDVISVGIAYIIYLRLRVYLNANEKVEILA